MSRGERVGLTCFVRGSKGGSRLAAGLSVGFTESGNESAGQTWTQYYVPVPYSRLHIINAPKMNTYSIVQYTTLGLIGPSMFNRIF
jgi:hypothetical protein